MDRSLPLAHIPDACISGPSTITLPQAVALCTVSPRPLSREARFCGRKKTNACIPRLAKNRSQDATSQGRATGKMHTFDSVIISGATYRMSMLDNYLPTTSAQRIEPP